MVLMALVIVKISHWIGRYCNGSSKKNQEDKVSVSFVFSCILLGISYIANSGQEFPVLFYRIPVVFTFKNIEKVFSKHG